MVTGAGGKPAPGPDLLPADEADELKMRLSK